MKNLSKRNKIILTTVGIVVVVAVIGLVITQPPANALFGAAANAITPSNPTVAVGGTTTVYLTWVSPSMGGMCNWSTSNSAVVDLANKQGQMIGIVGKAAGSATISVNCGPLGSATTTVNVIMPTVTVKNSLPAGSMNFLEIRVNTNTCSAHPGDGCTYNIAAGTGVTIWTLSSYNVGALSSSDQIHGCPAGVTQYISNGYGDQCSGGPDCGFTTYKCNNFTMPASAVTVTFGP